MSTPARVLHVLPHAGAGAQTYIDVLDGLDGYQFEIFELSASRSPATAVASIAGRQPALVRAARAADLLHFHGEVASLASLPVLWAKPSVVVAHGLHLLRRLAPGIPTRLGRAGMRAVVTGADRTLCSSQAERVDLGFLPQRLRAKVVVVLNSSPLPPPPDPAIRGRVRAALGLEHDAVAVLYLGQLEPRKDPLTAARAVAHARATDPRIVLLVAGSGPCEAELRTFTDGTVRLLGQRRDVSELLLASDVFVMPSWREGMSFAILEALSHGVATIVSDGPGNPEAVGDAGLVFSVGDDRGLATLLRELAGDVDQRSALGRAGRARIASELSTEQMRDGTRAVYDDVLRAPDRADGEPPA